LGIRLKPQCSMVDQNIELHVTKGYSPCIQSGYSIKAKFSNLLNIDDFFEILPSFASDIEFDEEEGIINLHGQLNGIPYRMNIFADGSIFLQSQDVNLDSDRILFFTLGNAMRIAKCSQCGTCVSICPVKATRVENRQIFIDRNKCLHCFKCITHCPFVVDIKDKIKYIELGK
jgi:phosphoadenosine phosphosulfate reductase